MLNKIIEISRGFQSSVNISYDLNNESKIRGFIPTTSALELITNIISSTAATSTERAKILTGAYGRGKSHIVLVTLAILKHTYRKSVFKDILNRLKQYDEDIYKIVDNFISSKTKLLPVIISGSSSNLTQAFINALQQALNAVNLDDIMPDTNYKAASDTIAMWKESYPDTYAEFTKRIKIKPEIFLSKLSQHDIKTYQTFVTLYPKLTAGSVFNPFACSDVTEVYEKVCASICERGYDGMYVVYDEFGKYLESNITTAEESETRFLQDFAEKCKRSGKQQMHLLLICHKDISNYIDANLSKEKVDGWRGISGRFEHINLHNNYSQMYEVISAVIGKNPDEWEDFCAEHEDVFDNLAHTFSDNKLLGTDVQAVRQNILGCYPLHPTTTFVLPRLSEKVAQNERTLFTFLSAEQKNTLVEVVEKCEESFTFVTPDHLYDYFEPQFKKELNSSDIFKIYQLAACVLKKVERGSLQSKIIKTIAVIYIIEQFEKYPPTINNIVNTFINSVSDPKEITDAVNDLINNSCIVYLKRSNGYLRLKESSGVNIKEEIQNRIEALKAVMSTKDILNALSVDSYLYPVKYNDEHCITRYFEFRFVDAEDLRQNYFSFEDRDASGLVRAVFFENSVEFEKFNVKKAKCDNVQTVTVIPKEFCDISAIAYEYRAVYELKEECGEDDFLANEYEVYLEDLDVVVGNFISCYTHPEMGAVEYRYQNKSAEISRKAQLSSLLSNICESIYPDAPTINNEMINKNVVPTFAVNSRSKVTTALLENDVIEENLGLAGTGQDVSIMRSTLIQTGIFVQKYKGFALEMNSCDEKIAKVLFVIKSFFTDTSSDGEKSFAELYYNLTSPDGKIGLKRGIIPIYIAVVLHFVKKDIVIRYKNEEVKITSDLLNSINESPEDYSVVMEDWDEDKAKYLRRLEEVFSDFVVEKEKSFNSFAYIAMAMMRWYVELPRCAKEMKEYYNTGNPVPKEYLKFINLLKQPTENSRELLMVNIPKIYGSKTPSLPIADSIFSAKGKFEGAKNELIAKIISITKDVFHGKKKASLASVLRDWYDGLKPETLQKQFPGNENTVIELIKSITNDDKTFILRLAKALVGLRIDDWITDSIKIFDSGLRKFKATVDDYNLSDHSHENSANSTKLVFVDESGNEVTRIIENVEYSGRAKLLYNDISAAVSEMGESISEQEKRQVLMDILKKLC